MQAAPARLVYDGMLCFPETMKYICNTEAVALYLQKYIVYRKRKISFADGSFTSFMELIMKYKDEKMLLVLSEPYKPEIAETMEKLNMNFDKVILSRTVSADLSDVDRSKYDMFVFFSPSEIVSLTANFGHDDLPMIATFGDGTTRAAINAGLRVNVKAPTPEAPSMAKAIDIFIGKINSGKEVAPVEFQESMQADEFIKAQDSKSARKSKQRTSLNGSAQQPEKLSGNAVIVNANELIVDGKGLFLFGIYADPLSPRGVEAKRFLEQTVSGKTVDCEIPAYTYQSVPTGICKAGEISLNHALVDNGYSKNVALDTE